MSSFWFCSVLKTAISVQSQKVFVPAPVHALTNITVQKGRQPPTAGKAGVKFHWLGDPVLRSTIQKQRGFTHDNVSVAVVGCTLPAFSGKQCPEIRYKTLHTTTVAMLVQWSPTTAVAVKFW